MKKKRLHSQTASTCNLCFIVKLVFQVVWYVVWYVEKDTQKCRFLDIAGAKYVSFDNQTLNPEAYVRGSIKSIAISHFFAW